MSLIEGARSVAGRSWLALLAQFTSETGLYDLEIDGVTAPLWNEHFTGVEALSTISDYRISAFVDRCRYRSGGSTLASGAGSHSSDRRWHGVPQRLRAIRAELRREWRAGPLQLAAGAVGLTGQPAKPLARLAGQKPYRRTDRPFLRLYLC